MRFNKLLIAMVLGWLGYSSSGWAQRALKPEELAPSKFNKGSINYYAGTNTVYSTTRYDIRTTSREKVDFERQAIAYDESYTEDGWYKAEWFQINNHVVTASKPYVEFELPFIFIENPRDDYNCGFGIYVSPSGKDQGVNPSGDYAFNRVATTELMDQGYVHRSSKYGGIKQVATNIYGNGEDKKGGHRYQVAKWRFYPSDALMKVVRNNGNGKFRIRICAAVDANHDGANSKKYVKIWGSEQHGDYGYIYTVECRVQNMENVSPTYQMLPNGKIRFKVGSINVPNWAKQGEYWSYLNGGGSEDVRHLQSSGTSGQELSFSAVDDPSNKCYVDYSYKVCSDNIIPFKSDVNNKGFWHAMWTPEDRYYIKGIPEASSIVATDDDWKRKITLSWSYRQSSSDVYRYGKWHIWRLISGRQWKYLGNTSNFDDRSYEDTDGNLEYDKEYTYRIAFCPDYYTFNSSDWESYKNAQTVNSTITRSFHMPKLEVKGGAKNIDIVWNAGTVPSRDADGRAPTFQLERHSENDPAWTNVGELVTVTSSTESTKATVHDNQGIENRITYYYRLKMSAMGRTFYSSTVSGSLADMFSVSGLEASTGAFQNTVKLSWKVTHQGSSDDFFRLLRRELKKDDGLGDEKLEWMEIYQTTDSRDNYFYEDRTALPGTYYEYKIVGMQRNPKYDNSSSDQQATLEPYDNTKESTAIGFAQSTGVVSGRVSYGTGTAVKGVRVNLYQDIDKEDADKAPQFSSMRLGAADAHLKWETEPKKFREIFDTGKPFTVQMWVKIEPGAGGAVLFSLEGSNIYESFNLEFWKDDYIPDTYDLAIRCGSYSEYSPYHQVKANEWVHITCAYNGQAGYTPAVYGRTLSGSWVYPSQANSYYVWNLNKVNKVRFGYSSHCPENFIGNLDDIRVWSKALTAEEEALNFDRILSGTESQLKLYWPLDEGINHAFDYSRTGGVSNGNNAIIFGDCQTSSLVPSKEQLGLYGVTDESGNYTVRGIPFNGEGVNYTIVPTMGIHEFVPHHSTRFMSAGQLNHSAVDFNDKSSFVVRGKVRYANTDYPVAGVNLYVDGQIASKDGVMAVTDANGEYEISVPIGDHYISVGKTDHVFRNDGRYPANTGLGELHTFEKEMSNLDFWDETLVTVAGRIVGGDIEGNKHLGFGESKNNLGKVMIDLESAAPQYRLNVLYNVSGTVVTADANPEVLPVESSNVNIKSNAYRGAGAENCGHIFIETDAKTGEFMAKVPPILYTIKSVKVVGSGESLIAQSQALDASNVSITDCDSVEREGVKYKFDWHTKYTLTHHTEPILSVTQEGNPEGAYGEQTYVHKEYDSSVEDKYRTTSLPLFEKAAEGGVTYNYQHPVFYCKDPYVFKLKGYEKFVNADDQKVDLVPLAGTVVTISNALSASQKVVLADAEEAGKSYKAGDVYDLKENQCRLDSLGEFTYEWQAGLPNITSPFTRSLGMSYNVGGREYQWGAKPMEGIILGDLTTGSNFVTAGPERLDYILRDPCGTGSFATWQKGVTVSTTEKKGTSFVNENEVNTVSSLGTSVNAITGTAGMGVMMGYILTSETRSDIVAGLKYGVEGDFSDETTMVTTTTQDVSTMNTNDYVGDGGDVFIGTGTNILFGKARQVGFHKNESDQLELGVKDVTSFGSEFTTQFFYSQNYVKGYLIPNLKNIRAEKLQTRDAGYIQSFKNNSDKLVYLTTLQPDDPDFGKPDTYKMFVPESKKNGTEEYFFTDSVYWVNLMLENWESYLYENERQKVEVFKQRDQWLRANHSFDVGATVTNTVSTETSKTTSRHWKLGGAIVAGYGTTAEVGAIGVTMDVTSETGVHHEQDTTSTVTHVSANSYTLAEEGERDALTVDVFEAPDRFGPIFRTRGGQTSVPYEGKVVTEYYEPGTTIMEATMQVEKPTIGVTQAVVSDVPSGRPANFTLQIRNESESADDLVYKLFVWDSSNPNGARITVDGEEVTSQRLMKVPYGVTMTKKLQIWQTDRSIYDYEDIELVIGSVEDKSVTNSVKLTAHFVPSSSDVTLEVPNTTMNTRTGDTFNAVIKDFDRTYLNFKSLALQFRYEEDDSWTQLKKYVMADDRQNEVIPQSGNIKVSLPMGAYADGRYTFRVVSASTYGNEEVTVNSPEITVIKDMRRPELLGSAHPTDGILSAGEDISVRFNEDIRQGMLTKDRNFRIFGARNDAKVAHDVALRLAGKAVSSELPVNLSGKDFTVDMWLKLESAGQLFAHGTKLNRCSMEADAEGHLVFKMGGQTLTSTAVVPQNKWVFLTFNYRNEGDGGKLSALCASDASEIALFTNEALPAYTGNGRVTLGDQLTGAMHEVCLWNVARDVHFSLSERTTGKSPVTPGLAGYWKMNEGHGTVVSDRAEGRHLLMESESWYLNNANKAVALDGSNYLAINTSAVSPRATESYALEFWFLMDAAQQAPATLMQSGNGKLALRTNESGNLELVADGVAYATTVKPGTDAWHHCLLNVGRGASAILYLDGKNVLTVPESFVPALAGHELLLGAQRTYSDVMNYTCKEYLKGAVDEVRIWNGQFTGKYLNDHRYERMDTLFAPGLVAYYPMEKKQLDEGSQVQEVFDLGDASVNFKTGGTAKVYQGSTPAEGVAAVTSPALKPALAKENLTYNFTASEREIFIKMNEAAVRLEGTTVDITLQEVLDLNGNMSAPITWSAYIRQNGLLWANDDVRLKANSGDGGSFTATITNKSGVAENWSLANLPLWLSADVEDGILAPASSLDIHFTVSPSIAVGNHDETVYLVGNQSISEALSLHVSVRAEAPDWSVDPTGFVFLSSLTGQVFVNGAVAENEETLVAAFVDGKCVGVNSLKYVPTRDAYYLFMNIHGNESEVGKPISLKIWDASTGVIYSGVKVENYGDGQLQFGDNVEFGSVANPVKLSTTPIIEQVVQLSSGWNWTSFYVDAESAALGQLKAHPNFLRVTNGVDFADVEGGALASLPGDRLFKVKMSAPTEMVFQGEEAPNSQTIGEGFNWIGGSHLINLPLQDAFTTIAHEGDLVKNLYGFSIYNGSVWEGSLGVIEPGKGYIYHSHNAESQTLVYPKYVSSGANSFKALAAAHGALTLSHFAGLQSAAPAHASNMTMVACVTRGGELVTDAEVAVYVGADFRTAAMTDGEGRLFLTIPGTANGEQLRFVVCVDDREYIVSSATSLFHADAHYGELDAPVSIDIDTPTGINLGTLDGGEGYTYFGLDGRAYGTDRKAIKRGVYILRDANRNTQKVMMK